MFKKQRRNWILWGFSTLAIVFFCMILLGANDVEPNFLLVLAVFMFVIFVQMFMLSKIVSCQEMDKDKTIDKKQYQKIVKDDRRIMFKITVPAILVFYTLAGIQYAIEKPKQDEQSRTEFINSDEMEDVREALREEEQKDKEETYQEIVEKIKSGEIDLNKYLNLSEEEYHKLIEKIESGEIDISSYVNSYINESYINENDAVESQE